MTRLLDSIKDPSLIPGLSIEERVHLAGEVRDRIIGVVCKTGVILPPAWAWWN